MSCQVKKGTAGARSKCMHGLSVISVWSKKMDLVKSFLPTGRLCDFNLSVKIQCG